LHEAQDQNGKWKMKNVSGLSSLGLEALGVQGEYETIDHALGE
jgi:hypothetical protein